MSFYLTKIPPKEALTVLSKHFGVDPKALAFGLNLRVIVARWERRFEEILHQHDLAGGRFSILAHLLLIDPKGCKASELAEKMGVTRGNMTSLVESLFKKKVHHPCTVGRRSSGRGVATEPFGPSPYGKTRPRIFWNLRRALCQAWLQARSRLEVELRACRSNQCCRFRPDGRRWCR